MNQNISISSPMRPQTMTGSTLLTCAVFILLGVIVPLVLFLNSDGDFSVNVLLMLCIVVWCQLRLAFTGIRGQRRFTLICFYAFIYVFLGVQPSLSVSMHAFPQDVYLSEGLEAFAGFLIVLGILAFELGYILGRGKVNAAHLYKKQYKILSLKILWGGNAVVGLMALLVMAYYGPGTFIALRGYTGDTIFWSRGVDYTELVFVVYAVRGLAAVLLFFTVYLWKIRTHLALTPSRLSSLKFALWFIAPLNLLVSNPIAAPRQWAGSLMLTLLFLSMRWKGIRSFLVLTMLTCLSLLTLFSGTDPRHFGAALSQGEGVNASTVGSLIKDGVQGLATDCNFDAFSMLAATTQYTENYGYSLGRQLLLPMFFWVPRTIWESKPEGTHKVVADSLGLDHWNVSSPLWSEGYMNFGVFGLFLFLFLFGWVARACDDFQVRTTDSPGPALQTVCSSFFASNAFILLRGDLCAGTLYLQLVVMMAFLVVYLDGRLFKGQLTSAI